MISVSVSALVKYILSWIVSIEWIFAKNPSEVAILSPTLKEPKSLVYSK